MSIAKKRIQKKIDSIPKEKGFNVKDGTDLINYWSKAGYCKYVDDKKRSLEWERECKVQFLAQVLPTEGSLNNILSKDTLVKFLNSKPQNMVRENTTYGFVYNDKIYLNV